MRSSTRAALLWVALAGALVLSAPTLATAAAGATVTGVPPTVNWGTTNTGGGASPEIRVLVSASISMSATPGVLYLPLFGITDLCRVGSACTGADVITRSGNMRMAAFTDACGAGQSCTNACTNGSNVVAMMVASPSTPGSGFTGKPIGYPLCAAAGGAAGNVGCTSCTANNTSGRLTVIKNFYVAVTVPTLRNSGTYQATLTFEVQ